MKKIFQLTRTKASTLILLLLGGMLTSFILQKKIYPFSQFDMYAYLLKRDTPYRDVQVWAKLKNGERVHLDRDDYFWPIGSLYFNFFYHSQTRKGQTPESVAKGLYQLYRQRLRQQPTKIYANAPKIQQIILYEIHDSIHGVIQQLKSGKRFNDPNREIVARYPK